MVLRVPKRHMLQSTFIHLQGIGTKTERALWNQGILTWDDFEQSRRPQPGLFDSVNRDTVTAQLDASRNALEKGDTEFFARLLPSSEHYRIALTFPAKTAFVDIETTGLSLYYDSITLVGVSIGDEYKVLVEGKSSKEIKEFIESAKCIVTFNGKIFDLPFIRKRYPNIHLPSSHVDLRFFGKRAGLSGGQKKIEVDIGLSREESIEGMSGENAPFLWHLYRLGDRSAAEKLIKYNFADIDGMRGIFDFSLSHLIDRQRETKNQADRPLFNHVKSSIRFARVKGNSQKNKIYVPKFPGKKGPMISYDDLVRDTPSRQFRVVGIDLTGSEQRPTGWCLLDGNIAHTLRLARDLEIVSETVQAEPHLISIDSPLSMPKGRLSVDDADPGRDEFGIMRVCERILKRRGVNVYPSLIPSMQKLTKRGISLAATFRSMGYPVIESYPGAAQDIIRIPRKHAGLSLLSKSLADFGLKGLFEKDAVSHDELDAITSAIVGLFFWSGKFEALGNEDEEYLIIPDLEVENADWTAKRVIGFSGEIAAGKTTAARYLENRRFTYARFSEVLAELLAERGETPNRQRLQEFGEQVHRDPGQRWLCKQVASKLHEAGDSVIDGIRFPEDYATLVETFGPAFKLIHIDAEKAIRKKRYSDTKGAPGGFDRASNHFVESKVSAMTRPAAIIIKNHGKLSTFHNKIVRAL